MWMNGNKNIVFIVGSASALLAGLYVLWGPSDSSRKKRKRGAACPGLVNLGNSCFLNSILQALAPCASASQWLADYLKTQSQIAAHSLVDSIYRTLQVLNNESIEYTDEYCPADVMMALKARRWHIPADEQDAHELFHVLTETLGEEQEPHRDTLSLFEAQRLEECPSSSSPMGGHTRIGTRLPAVSRHGKMSPFTGILASQLQCTTCGYKNPVHHDHFDSLSLPIPSNTRGEQNVYNLLGNYMRSETVDRVECQGCAKRMSSAGKKSTFVKRLTIAKLPRCLCIHVQRTTWLNNGMPVKCHDHVQLPETLNMAAYLYHQQLTQKMAVQTNGLLGGQEQTKVHKSPEYVSTLKSPYSGPVNMLKALHYHNRLTTSNLRPTAATTSSSSPSTEDGKRKLAQMYSMEQQLSSTTSSSTSNATSSLSGAKTATSATQHSYKLMAVVCHYGDVFSGHFATYRRAPATNGERFPKHWLYCSDTAVRRVSMLEVQAADAYMLFYEHL